MLQTEGGGLRNRRLSVGGPVQTKHGGCSSSRGRCQNTAEVPLSTVTNPQMPCEESLHIVYPPHNPERDKAVKETRQGYSTMHEGWWVISFIQTLGREDVRICTEIWLCPSLQRQSRWWYYYLKNGFQLDADRFTAVILTITNPQRHPNGKFMIKIQTYKHTYTYIHTCLKKPRMNPNFWSESKLTNSSAVLKVDQQSKFRTNEIRLGVNILWQFDVAGCIELFSTSTEITK